MEDLTQRFRQAADLVRELAREVQETVGWSASVGEAKDLTDAVNALRGAGEAAYLRAVRIQDERERATCPPGRGKYSTADCLVFRYRLDRGQALRDVAAARALDATTGTLPTFAAELLDGRVNRGHVDAALRIVEAIPATLRDRIVDTPTDDTPDNDNDTDTEAKNADADAGDGGDGGDAADGGEAGEGRPVTVVQVAEAFLLTACGKKPPRAVTADGQELLARLDPATADGRDPGADARRALTYVLGSDGCLHLRIIVPPLDAPQMKSLVHAFGKPTPTPAAKDCHHDQQGDQQGDVQGVLPVPDERTLPARRYDAFAATLFAGAECGGSASGDGTRVIVTATPEHVAAAAAAETRHGQEQTGQPQTGQAQTGQPQTGQPQTGQPQTGQPQTGQPQTGQPQTGQEQTGQEQTGQEQTGQEQTGQTPTRQAQTTPQVPAAGLAMVDGFGPISPVVLAYLLCGARLTRVLLSPSGQVLDVGRDVRDATPAQRKALVARDRGCIVPSCDQGAGACIPHHVQEWQHGGPTALSNLALLCPRHHREVHLDIWNVVIHHGLPHVIAPSWLDPDRIPRRNTDHRISDHARIVGDQLRLALNPPDTHPQKPRHKPPGEKPGEPPSGDVAPKTAPTE